MEGDLSVHTSLARGEGISIHAFRVEGDKIRSTTDTIKLDISIHAFRVEGDNATYCIWQKSSTDFNPRLPCGRRPITKSFISRQSNFNPRLPCGRRQVKKLCQAHIHLFQSTPSVWKATFSSNYYDQWLANFNPRLPCGRRL